MANWYGTARSNQVKIKDVPGLVAAVSPFDLTLHPRKDDFYMFSGDQDSGGWPSWSSDEDGNEIEFDPRKHICPFMEEGQVLIMMCSGAEKLRYITGDAQAYNHEGKGAYISLDDIYKKASKKFKTSINNIALAEY